MLRLLVRLECHLLALRGFVSRVSYCRLYLKVFLWLNSSNCCNFLLWRHIIWNVNWSGGIDAVKYPQVPLHTHYFAYIRFHSILLLNRIIQCFYCSKWSTISQMLIEKRYILKTQTRHTILKQQSMHTSLTREC